MPPELSVIVPVLNEIGNLETCLDALDNQTLPRRHYELVVVDNGSRDGSFEAAGRHRNIKLLHEPEPDVYMARNRGIKAADGEIIAFTDSHCVADRDWLRVIRRAFREGGADLAVGRLSCRADASRPLKLYDDYYDVKTSWVFDRQVTACYFGHGGNMALKRSILDEIGLFEPLPRAGDTEIIHRLLRHKSDSAVRYLPDARVQRQSVRTFLHMLSKLRRYGAYTQAISSHGDGFRALSLSERLRVFSTCIRSKDRPMRSALALSAVLAVGLLVFNIGRLTQTLGANGQVNTAPRRGKANR